MTRARSVVMPTDPKHGHRRQKSADLTADDDLRPMVVNPLPSTDRMHNPDDIDVDEAAIAAGVTHGGTQESRAEAQAVRGAGRNKRATKVSRRHETGRDLSKKR